MVNGEIRGLARPIFVAGLNRHLVFLIARSNMVSGETMSFEVYDPEVIARIHEAGLTGLVVLLPRERPESETVAEGPFLSKEEYIHSAAAAVINFGGSVDATTHTLTASGGDSLFWPGFYFFVFITTTDMQDSGQQSLVGIVRSDIIAGAGDRQPHVVIVASGL